MRCQKTEGTNSVYKEDYEEGDWGIKEKPGGMVTEVRRKQRFTEKEINLPRTSWTSKRI